MVKLRQCSSTLKKNSYAFLSTEQNPICEQNPASIDRSTVTSHHFYALYSCCYYSVSNADCRLYRNMVHNMVVSCSIFEFQRHEFVRTNNGETQRKKEKENVSCKHSLFSLATWQLTH